MGFVFSTGTEINVSRIKKAPALPAQTHKPDPVLPQPEQAVFQL
jgi:hypothetical protein